jgi:hypothetical protein
MEDATYNALSLVAPSCCDYVKKKKTLKKFILGEGEKLRGGFVTSCQV